MEEVEYIFVKKKFRMELMIDLLRKEIRRIERKKKQNILDIALKNTLKEYENELADDLAHFE